jgi:hypothetical protein
LTGCRRRKPKRQATPNTRWLHLGARQSGQMRTIQTVMATTSSFCMSLNQLRALILAAETVVTAQADMAVLHAAFDSVSITLVAFLGLLRAMHVADAMLFDIPFHEEAAPQQFTRSKNLRIADLNDVQALKMTHFSQSQLRHLYAHFGLATLAAGVGTTIPIFTGRTYYQIHPEELFLFTLTKLATGLSNIMIVDTYFGGDYNRWTYGYPWMLRYLDERYKHIVGHQGLTRFVVDFPRFHRAIEEYVQRNHLRELVDGTMTIIPGINFMPWDVFAFIDDSIDCISTPFSGPRGDYEGAARREEYADAQQAFYTGYIKAHGIKIETVFLPNGLCTLFGPVSARRADAGVAAMSNLNAFLVLIQRGQFFSPAGTEVLFSAFGDCAFNLGHQCIQSYYRAFGAGAQLTDAQKRCNAAMRSARITVEKNYAMVSNLFHICSNKDNYKIAKEKPYAIEQLRVCTLLTNCYVCMNGDVAGSDNTFGLSPPMHSEYLRL